MTTVQYRNMLLLQLSSTLKDGKTSSDRNLYIYIHILLYQTPAPWLVQLHRSCFVVHPNPLGLLWHCCLSQPPGVAGSHPSGKVQPPTGNWDMITFKSYNHQVIFNHFLPTIKWYSNIFIYSTDLLMILVACPKLPRPKESLFSLHPTSVLPSHRRAINTTLCVNGDRAGGRGAFNPWRLEGAKMSQESSKWLGNGL